MENLKFKQCDFSLLLQLASTRTTGSLSATYIRYSKLLENQLTNDLLFQMMGI